MLAVEVLLLTPTISGNSPFLTSTDVTITCGTDGAAIQYSTDNGTSWNAYSEPFTLTATTTVKAKATKSGSTDSDEASKTFTKVTPMKVAGCPHSY
jgi:Chitobiase/beta-hexosaminidase C-terminal domain.